MIRLQIKPLSVNEAWQGKRFKTDRYKKYERDLLLLLPSIKIPDGRLEIFLEFGVSSRLSDFDNPTKLFVDILQKKYGFNDNKIYKATIIKTDVPKNKEFIRFNISSL